MIRNAQVGPCCDAVSSMTHQALTVNVSLPKGLTRSYPLEKRTSTPGTLKWQRPFLNDRIQFGRRDFVHRPVLRFVRHDGEDSLGKTQIGIEGDSMVRVKSSTCHYGQASREADVYNQCSAN